MEIGLNFREASLEILTRVQATIKPKLIARRLFPIEKTLDPNIPILSKAVIKDEENLTESINDIAQQIADLEDHILLSGEHIGFEAQRLEGLTTSTGRSLIKSKTPWPKNARNDVFSALEIIGEKTSVEPNLIMILPLRFIDPLSQIIDRNISYNEMLTKATPLNNIFYTDNLYAADGGQDSAIIIPTIPPVAKIKVHHEHNYKVFEYQTKDPDDEEKLIDWIRVSTTAKLKVEHPERIVEIHNIEIE